MLAAKGFDVLVLAAKEHQPHAEYYPDLAIIRVPLTDTLLQPVDWLAAQRAASEVARAYLAGARVLVTCQAGLNRSGLVNALALHALTGMSGDDAQRLVRRRRRGALFNPSYVQALKKLPGIRRPLRLS